MEGKTTEYIPIIKWKVLRKCHACNQKKRQCILSLNEKYETVNSSGDNLLNKRIEILVPVDTKTNINLKIATQKTDVINQFNNVIKDNITLT